MSRRKRFPVVIVVMGVSGVGKTTIGTMLASRLGWAYYDADDFHPAENVEKMRRGIPLTDEDREGWLTAIGALIRKRVDEDAPAVVSCSALKESYRRKLEIPDEKVALLYLKAPKDVVEERIRSRSGHFFSPDLLTSQYQTLEEPSGAVVVNATPAPAAVVSEAVRKLSTEF